MEDFLIVVVEKLFFMPFLMGLIFVITALISLRFPPKKINNLYGYRTGKSMKNQQISVRMLQIGFFLLAVSFLGLIFHLNEKQQVIFGVTLSVLVCIYLFWSTERAIKKNFPNE